MATSSSSSSSSCNWVFDVFPSFRGEDVRRTFLSHLLLALDCKLVTCFKDNEMARSQSIGLELVHAIRDSRIAIVVFSKIYASSSWCLNELLEIVKCKEEKGQMVIPVFYGVDPSHVRKQTGEFGKAFEMICKNRSDELPIRWRGALTDVANIHGYHSDNWNNEANLIEEIANDVLGRLSLTPSMEFGDFAGIEDHLAKMSLLLQLESAEVRMVGIWGPSGIGKTTIARALFGRISRHFQSSVFIDRAFVCKTMEIYRTANPDDYNMKLRLQERFLSEILTKKDIKIHHLGAVGERLKHKRVLIVLDDLSDQVLLDALGSKEVLGISLNLAELYELLRIDKKAFRRLRNLRFLRIYKDSLDLHKQVRLHLPGGLEYLPPKLKLLCWDGYPMRCLPSSFFAEHLIVLSMRNSKLEKLWEGFESSTCLEDMVEVPHSVRKLNKIYMGDCTELDAVPTGINLESLYRLDLGGCSRFRSFPNISTNISFLILNQTAIKEVPWWIENFSRLVCLEMWECKRLSYISPNISKLKLLEKANFSNCGALTDASWLDRPNVVATEANSIHTKLPALNFINCFKLDQEALIQQSVFKYLILPGGKVPSYFTSQAIGSSLVIRLLQSSLSQQLLEFRACLVVDANEPKSITSSWIISCLFTGKDGSSFGSADCHLAIDLPRQMDNHLVIFDCRFPLNKDNDSLAELNYDRVEIEIKFTTDSRCKIKGCGVRFSEACSYLDNQLSNVCESDKSNMVTDGSHETKHDEELGDSSAEARRSRK